MHPGLYTPPAPSLARDFSLRPNTDIAAKLPTTPSCHRKTPPQRHTLVSSKSQHQRALAAKLLPRTSPNHPYPPAPIPPVSESRQDCNLPPLQTQISISLCKLQLYTSLGISLLLQQPPALCLTPGASWPARLPSKPCLHAATLGVTLSERPSPCRAQALHPTIAVRSSPPRHTSEASCRNPALACPTTFHPRQNDNKVLPSSRQQNQIHQQIPSKGSQEQEQEQEQQKLNQKQADQTHTKTKHQQHQQQQHHHGNQQQHHHNQQHQHH
jgi:hypothetical protein